MAPTLIDPLSTVLRDFQLSIKNILQDATKERSTDYKEKYPKKCMSLYNGTQKVSVPNWLSF